LRKEAQQRATSVLHTTMERLHRHLSTVETATEVNAWLVTEHMQPDSLLAFTRLITLLNSNVRGEIQEVGWERRLCRNQLDENVIGEVGLQFERGY
jgi:hypothetical protein